ncbi:MAG: HprK-related kinase A [Methylomarinum sp.]|nr:HprK-related kinase A [Methylomarinum sp.]
MNTLDVALKTTGVFIKTGPFVSLLKSRINGLGHAIEQLYYAPQISYNEEFADFHLSIEFPNILRRWFRPQILFKNDGRTPFNPLPAEQLYPFFEWGLNWCIANHSNHFLILHAAVVEKNGYAIVFPAAPGSGKSTLCAGLVSRGWRLLSDEMAIIEPETLSLVSVVRPISLKNESIDVIKAFAPDFEFGSITRDTAKGTVTHIKAPIESLNREQEKAQPACIVFPKYQAGAASLLKPVSKVKSVLRAAEESFNYNVLGEKGFTMLCDLVDGSDCYEFVYSDLSDAVNIFNSLIPSKS